MVAVQPEIYHLQVTIASIPTPRTCNAPACAPAHLCSCEGRPRCLGIAHEQRGNRVKHLLHLGRQPYWRQLCGQEQRSIPQALLHISITLGAIATSQQCLSGGIGGRCSAQSCMILYAETYKQLRITMRVHASWHGPDKLWQRSELNRRSTRVH